MVTKVIGIISYLPDNRKIRDERKLLIRNLINRCNQVFNLPIIVIAQNWPSSLSLWAKAYGCSIYEHPQLGITGARKELRNVFLSSTNYDVLIMLDDDCDLLGNSGKEYLKQIDDHPNKYYEYYRSVLKLFAISRHIYSQMEFPNINPENAEGFEDRVFYYTLCKKFPEDKYTFHNTGISQISRVTADPLSTWYKNQNLKEMLDKTQNIIDNFDSKAS